jgi:ABC-type uncharacterized transport system substrate-binding protein
MNGKCHNGEKIEALPAHDGFELSWGSNHHPSSRRAMRPSCAGMRASRKSEGAGNAGCPTHSQQAADIVPAIESLKGRAQALYVPITPFISVNQTQINSLALDARLPTVHGLPEFARSGGSMSYGADFLDMLRRAGDYLDRVPRGTKPGELPVEQPTKFDLVISLKTAKALGLTFPTAILATANEVIE